MADNKLIGQNYTTPDIVAKVTGKAKYAEDFRADGMLFAKLLLSPLPHARVKNIDASAALAMPGVKAIITAVRTELAQEYLTNRNRKLYEIADLLGFSSPGAFSRWFCDQFGRTPSDWAANYRASQTAAEPVSPK